MSERARNAEVRDLFPNSNGNGFCGSVSIAAAAEFETIFWPALPKAMRRCGTKIPRTKFVEARERGVDLQTIMDGLEAYKKHKDSYADWCMASTWLNQERWTAEYDDGIDFGKYDAP